MLTETTVPHLFLKFNSLYVKPKTEEEGYYCVSFGHSISSYRMFCLPIKFYYFCNKKCLLNVKL